MPLYVVALLLRETLGKEEFGYGAEGFSTIAQAFFTSFRCFVAGDCTDNQGRPIMVLVAQQYGWSYGFVYSVIVVLMSFGLFNVIVAIYVENTVAAAKYNDQKIKEQRLRDEEAFKQKSLELAMLAFSLKNGTDTGMGHSPTGTTIPDHNLDLDAIYAMQITQEGFVELCKNPGFSELLADLDIAAADQQDLFDTLDADRGGSLDICEIIDGIGRLRGEAQKADVVAVLVNVRHIIEVLETHNKVLDKMWKRIKSMGDGVDRISIGHSMHIDGAHRVGHSQNELSRLGSQSELSQLGPQRSVSFEKQVMLI